MISLRSLFGTPPDVATARELYATSMHAARQPVFFTYWGVPDTPEGRFEMLVLTAFLTLRRLKEIDGADALSQAYFDVMFEDIDHNLRELGVGDINVGKKVKKLAESFYGRIKAYDSALNEGDDSALKAALARYPFREVSPEDTILDDAATYVRRQSAYLADQADDRLLAGEIAFAALADLLSGEREGEGA